MIGDLRNDKKRKGFTLLEVLLTVMLSMILLAGLWSLSNIYLRTFERGQDLAEQAQLLRAIQQQLNDDLLGLAAGSQKRMAHPGRTEVEGVESAGSETGVNPALVPPPSLPGFATTEAAALPVFSLRGTERSLQLTVLRELIPSAMPETGSAELEALTGEGISRLPNWRVVRYQFRPRPEVESEQAGIDEDLPPTGLSRREIAWEDLIGSETPDELLLGTADFEVSPEMGATSSVDMGATLSEGEETNAANEILNEKEERVELPQVVTCRFRYYDGAMWLSSWESSPERGLPTAIEVMLQIEPTGAAQRARLQRSQEVQTPAAVEDEENTVLQEPDLESKPEWPLYRQVFFLGKRGGPEGDRNESGESRASENFPGETTPVESGSESIIEGGQAP